ncbi:AAA family ATPase [Micromonospora sp. LOL_023]|uniref:AAA family ATPase n=1 Tax=Micromonospora sp. LOL_023 TaxID=3345418 RepID=UPI003A8B3978
MRQPDGERRSVPARAVAGRAVAVREGDVVQVRLFDELSILRRGQPLSIPPGKALELFGYLLVHRDRTHARESISELLWPGAEPGAARKYLRQALWRLNTSMQEQSNDRRLASNLVVIDPGWVRINPAASCWLDVDAFEQSYAAVRDVPGEALSDEQTQAVEHALKLYRGDLLATWHHDWCGAERDRLRDTYLVMQEQLVGYCVARGLYARGVSLGQAVLRQDVARERIHRQLMRLHYAAGDRIAALRQYDLCASVVDEEFGVPPSADTTLLYEHIRADRAVDVGPESSRPPLTVHATTIAPAAADGDDGPVGDNRDEVRVSMDGAGYANSTEHLLAELARLDLVLGRRVRRVRQTQSGPAGELSADYVSEAEADRLLDNAADRVPPGDDDPQTGAELDELSQQIATRVAQSLRDGVDLRLVALAGTFGLAPFDVEVIVVCLAPEIDRRYERLYGYLHDDLTRRLPTVELVLAILCADRRSRMAARARLAPSAPLLRHRLVTSTEDPTAPVHSLLGNNLRLDPRVVGFLLEDDELVEQLRPYARLVAPTATLDDLHFPAEFGAALALLSKHADEHLIVYCQGPYGVGRRSVAAACARYWNAPLLRVSADLLADRPAEEFASLVGLVEREARLQGAVMCWTDVDPLLAEPARPRLSLLLSTLAAYPAPAFLAGGATWEPVDLPAGLTFVRLEFPAPGYAERLRIWDGAFVGPDREMLDLAAVAGKFRLTGGQIRDAAATAHNLAYARTPEAPGITQDDLYAACRLQSNRKLADLAQRITPHYGWSDIVLPADRMQQLREIANQLRYRSVVYESWEFERKLANGRGLAVLFAGPSGTGKTMAADVLAHELGLDLYKIDLSTVVSKYIGETEKNLSRIFAEAATSNAVLFFDEADAMFGKRSQVRDAHDRYANLEVSYLLQRMEQHEGVVILATNLRKNLDDAFTRRLHATIDFPIPDVADRCRIWAQVWPDQAPLDPAVDFDLLARQVDLPGGNIRNIALASAFLAAADGGKVTMAHLLHATRREYQKMGKILSAGEFGADLPDGKVAVDRRR